MSYCVLYSPFTCYLWSMMQVSLCDKKKVLFEPCLDVLSSGGLGVW